MVFSVAATLGLAACSATYRNHGYVPPETDLAQLVVGQTNQAQVESLIGRPGAEGVLTGSAWYYVGSRWEHFGPRQPREIQRQVLVVSFDAGGNVSNIERFGLEQGNVVALSRRVTDTGVASSGLLRQLLGNVGRVSAGQLLNETQ